MQEVGSGNYANAATGELQLSEDWATYSSFGGASGVTVVNLTPLIEYIFKVKARNGDNVETGFGLSTSGTTMASKVWIETEFTDPGIILSSVAVSAGDVKLDLGIVPKTPPVGGTDYGGADWAPANEIGRAHV